jgi:drug/metabolite transporter (DMT)-like permease
MTAVPSATRARVVVALVVVYLVWGTTYLGMRFAVAAMPPWGMAGSRFLTAGLLALIAARIRREPLPSLRDWMHGVPSGVFLFVVGNGLVAVAEQSIPSSVAAVVAATTPLFAAAMNSVRGERPTRAEALGMGLGMAGVVVLAGSGTILHQGLRGIVLLVAPVGFAFGSLLVRARGRGTAALAAAAPQMVSGGIVMLATSLVVGERMPATLPWTALAAWLYLVVVGSLVGFTAYAWLLRHTRASIAMSYAYVNPLVAVVLGAVVGGERLAWTSALASALIAGGVMLAVTVQAAPTSAGTPAAWKTADGQ